MSDFGIWYDDGHVDFGWLAEEGRHGRQHRAEYLTLADAEQAAARQREYDPSTVFYPAALDTDRKALFKTVRGIAAEAAVKRAEQELERP